VPFLLAHPVNTAVFFALVIYEFKKINGVAYSRLNLQHTVGS
jgi:hypothetical protein